MNEFIVAEVSKNWERSVYIGEIPAEFCICGQFEKVIEYNRQRGYVLHSFQLHRLMVDDDTLNETIVAVFQKVGGTP